MQRTALALGFALALGGAARAQEGQLPAPAGWPTAPEPAFVPAERAWGAQPVGGWFNAPSPLARLPQTSAPPQTGGCEPDPRGFAFDPCFPHQRTGRPKVHNESWVRGDWLSWSFRDMPVPPLIVSGDPTQANAGIPGGGNVRALVGPTRDLGQFNGARLAFGSWFDPAGELGGEITGTVFARNGTSDSFAGSATQTLSVPVVGTNGLVGVYDFSFPGTTSGALVLNTATQLWGAEANLLRRWYGDGCLSVDTLFGYRYLQLVERIELLGRATPVPGNATFGGAQVHGGASLLTFDSFRTRTEFHGAQIGGRVEYRRDMFTLTAFGKGGVGATVQTLRVAGNTTLLGANGSRTTLPGGVRALPSNMGRDTNTDFSLLGETGIEIGLQLTKHASLRVGYNLLYVTDVLRPANVISPVVSLGQVPIDPTFGTATGAARPVTVFRASDFLAHGLTVGAVFDW
jgi:hypothetical protein